MIVENLFISQCKFYQGSSDRHFRGPFSSVNENWFRDELNSVAKWINSKGRVSLEEIQRESDKLIKL